MNKLRKEHWLSPGHVRSSPCIHPRHNTPAGDQPQTTCAFTEPHPPGQPITVSTTLSSQADAIQLHHLSYDREATLCSADALPLCPTKLPHTLDVITQQETVESHFTAVIM